MSDNLMRLFLRRLDEGQTEKVAQGVSAFIRTKIKERGIFRRIIPPQYVTTGDPNLQRDLDHDSVYYVAEKEPETFAISLTFAGEPGAIQPKGKRVRIDFYQHSTPKIEKTEQELLAYSYSLHQWITDNAVKDLEMQEDSLGFGLTLAALKASGQYFDYSAGGGVFSKEVLLEAASLIDKSARTGEASIIVVNKATFDVFLKQNATVLGDELAKEVFISGYKYQTILGLNFVITRNNKVIPPGIFYVFSAPEWLGKSPMLGDAKFFVKKEGPKIEYLIWEHYGIGLVNGRGVVAAYDHASTNWHADANGIYYQPGGVGPKYYKPPYPEPEE